MTVPEHTATAPEDTAAVGVLTALEEAYAQVKRVSRELRGTDRIAVDLGVDSLATMEMLLTVEERFAISLVDDPRTARVTTVGELVDLITALRAEAAA